MNRLLKIRQFSRYFSTSTSANVIEQLKNRTLLKVIGNEADDYIQGLITNDINHISNGGCMYTLFLNTKGRVLYDAIVYKAVEDNTFLIECDLSASDQLLRHLKIYKLRRKLDILKMTDELDILSMYNPDNLAIKKESDVSRLDGAIVPCDTLAETFPKDAKTVKLFKDLLVYRDPRMFLLGSRVICPRGTNVKEQISEIYDIRDANEQENYRWYRYNLGIGEGVADHPIGNCFPLEANCDYLHGVSFHKGCYIGQELTARTYHTGVIRKRLMPLIFTKLPTTNPESIIHNDVNLGKLRGIEGNAGLGLLRISQSLELNEFTVGDGVARTLKPIWWPVEAPKERLSAQRSE